MSQRLNPAGIWTPSVCLSTVRFRWELCRVTDKWCQCWSSNRLQRDARRRGSEDEEPPGREYKEKLENRKRLARKTRRRKQGSLDKGGKQRKSLSFCLSVFSFPSVWQSGVCFFDLFCLLSFYIWPESQFVIVGTGASLTATTHQPPHCVYMCHFPVRPMERLTLRSASFISARTSGYLHTLRRDVERAVTPNCRERDVIID